MYAIIIPGHDQFDGEYDRTPDREEAEATAARLTAQGRPAFVARVSL